MILTEGIIAYTIISISKEFHFLASKIYFVMVLFLKVCLIPPKHVTIFWEENIHLYPVDVLFNNQG